jgi:hypothetical protein
MTQVGEGVNVATIAQETGEDIEDINVLRFKLVDDNGKAVSDIPYKTVKKGESAEPLHITYTKTSFKGLTQAVSTTNDEEIDFYLVWAKLTVDKSFFKT